MQRHCPECKAQMRDDGVNCWCVQYDCDFKGYRDLRTGKILPPEPDDAQEDRE